MPVWSEAVGDEGLNERVVREIRSGKLQIRLVGDARAGSRILLIGVGDAQHRQWIGIPPALFLPVDHACGERERAGRQLRQAPGEIGCDRGKFIAASVARREEDVVLYCLAEIAEAQIVRAGKDRKSVGKGKSVAIR